MQLRRLWPVIAFSAGHIRRWKLTATSRQLTVRLALLVLLAWQSGALADSFSPTELADLVDRYRSSDPPLALQFGEDALALLDQQPDPKVQVRVMAEMVWALRRLGRYSEALVLGAEAQTIAERIQDQAGLSRTLNNIGIVYWYLGDHEATLDNWLRALAIREETGDDQGVAGSLNNIGLVYADLGEYQQAIEQFTRALEISERLGNTEYQANHLDNLGEVFAAMNQPAMAEQQYLQGLAIARADINQKAEISILVNLGTLMLQNGDDVRAVDYLTSGQNLAMELGEGTKQAEAALRLAELALGQGDPQRALAIAEPALATARARGDKALMRDLSRSISEIHSALGQDGEALAAYRDYSTLQEEMLKSQRDDKITLLQIQFEAANREREIERLILENELRSDALQQARTNRRLMTTALALLVILILSLILAYRSKHRTNQLIRRQNAELEANRRELMRLASSDSLTGLLNRRALAFKMDELADQADPQSGSGNPRFGLCLLDLDSFKAVNDEFGHEAGDAVLVEVANRLAAAVSPEQSVARWGGEEFMILVPGGDLAAAGELAEKARKALERAPVVYRDLAIPIAASFGVSAHIGNTRTIRATLRAADQALYRAKRQGGNQVCFEEADADDQQGTSKTALGIS